MGPMPLPVADCIADDVYQQSRTLLTALLPTLCCLDRRKKMTTTNLIAVTFNNDSEAFQALSELRKADSAGTIELRSAGVVERDSFGTLSIAAGDDAVSGAGLAGGGLVGMLIGVLGGPIGMLVGWSAGAVVGSAIDVSRMDAGEMGLEVYGSFIPAGSNALVAEVEEKSTHAVDAIVSSLAGVTIRRPAYEVLAELELAQDAADAAASEARKIVRAEKRATKKEHYEERKASLRVKLHLA